MKISQLSQKNQISRVNQFSTKNGVFPLLVLILTTSIIFSGCGEKTVSAPSPTPEAVKVVQEKEVEAAKDQDTAKYENQEFSFALNKPDGWESQEEVEGTVVAFMSPKESSDDSFQENISISVQDEDETLTLESYNKAAKKQIPAALEEGKVIETKKITLAGQGAYSLIYTGKLDGEELKWQAVYSIKDSKPYVVVYTARPESFDKFAVDMSSVVSSFKFVTSQSGADGAAVEE